LEWQGKMERRKITKSTTVKISDSSIEFNLKQMLEVSFLWVRVRSEFR
jgi:hypothetical protein